MSRKNPEDPKQKKLPHEDKDLLKASELFERGYSKIRSELGAQKEILPPEEIESSIMEEMDQIIIKRKKKDDLAQLKAPIDFTRHFENLAAFQLDLEAFLAYLKTKYREHTPEGVEARNVFQQYRIIYRRIKELITAIKGL